MTIALVGNPNSGKSSLFNMLTGLRQKIGNFPGVTVEKKTGILRLGHHAEQTVLIDLPGTYSLYPTSNDERVVLNVLTNPKSPEYPDAIVYVADITQIEKHLLLLTQVRDLGIPCLLALNMADIATNHDLSINQQRLGTFLQMPVVLVSSKTGFQIEMLKEEMRQLLSQKRESKTPLSPFYSFNQTERSVVKDLRAFNIEGTDYCVKLIAHHFQDLPYLKEEEKKQIAAVCQTHEFKDLPLQINETMSRFNKFEPALKRVRRDKEVEDGFTDELDAILTHRFFAPLIFFVIMFLVFQAIYAWASYPMDMIDAGFAFLTDTTKNLLPASWVTSLLTDGILAGLGGILIFIPQIAILFFLVSLLEEVGYMARAVFIFDRLMQKFGLNGRSIVALISGGACAIPAVMSTRTIGNWKERLITIMVTPLISCSARIPVYAVLIGFVVPSVTVWGFFNMQGLAFMGLYVLGIVAALGSAWVFKKILKSDEPSYLMMELPPYRMPVWRNIWQNVYEKVKAFVLEAGKVIMVISVILWVLASYGPSKAMQVAEQDAVTSAQAASLSEEETADLIAAKRIEASYAGHIGKAIEPAIEPLGFDWKIGIALITSFAAREVFVGTMATIYSIGSTEDEGTIHNKLAAARHAVTGAKVYTPATSMSLLIFYVFAMQCMSTLAVVKRETGSWKWAFIQFFYMSALAYFGSLLTFQWLS